MTLGSPMEVRSASVSADIWIRSTATDHASTMHATAILAARLSEAKMPRSWASQSKNRLLAAVNLGKGADSFDAAVAQYLAHIPGHLTVSQQRLQLVFHAHHTRSRFLRADGDHGHAGCSQRR